MSCPIWRSYFFYFDDDDYYYYYLCASLPEQYQFLSSLVHLQRLLLLSCHFSHFIFRQLITLTLHFFFFFATWVTSESPCIFVKMNYSPLQRPERGRDGDWHSLDVHVYCCRNVYLFHRSIGYQFLPTFLCHSSHRNTVRSIEYGNV